MVMAKCCITTTSNKALQNAKNKISRKEKSLKIKPSQRRKHLVALIPKAVTKYLSPLFDQEVQL